MKFASGIIVAGILFVLCDGIVASAESFTTPLSFTSQTGDNGQYLSAEFDFHTAFSSIDSVTLQFTMPNGFTGQSVDTNHGSIHNQLWMAVHSTDGAPDFGLFDAANLYNVASSVPPGTPQQLGMFTPIIVFTDPPTIPWPDFIFNGVGAIGIADYQWVLYDDPAGPISFTSLLPFSPGEIAGASLVVVGTAVPEPGTISLAAAGGLMLMCCAYSRRSEPARHRFIRDRGGFRRQRVSPAP